jgi:hypothetical protein
MSSPVTTVISSVANTYGTQYCQSGQFFFPTDDIPVEEKGAEWCLAWQQAIWSLFVSGGCYSTTDDYDKMQLLRLYGAGRQPNGVYQNLILGPDNMGSQSNTANPTATATGRRGWLSTNWDIFSPAPKLHREIKGRFDQQEFDYVATAVDPSSQSEKENKMWEIWYNSRYGEKEREVMSALKVEVDKSTQYIAQSLEELELFKELGGFKLQSESQLEIVLDQTDSISDMKTIKDKFIDDLIDFNKAAYRDLYDPITGLTTYEYVDFVNLIIDYSNEKDFKDIRFWSYLKFETLNTIRVKNPQLNEADIIKTARANLGMWGNMATSEWDKYRDYGYKTVQGVRIYDQFRVPVLISEWISTDSEYKSEKINKTTGEKKIYPQKHGKYYNTENKKTKVTRVNNVYQSSWVLGSKIVYDHGKSLNTARPNPKVPKLSIHAITIPGKSIIETIQPVLDQIELTWVRKQSATAQAAPPGMDFDISQLEDVTIGGQKLNLYQLIMLKRQTGDTIRRTRNLTNNKINNQGRPINRNEGGLGEYMNELITDLSHSFNLIYELTGVDVVSAASAEQAGVTATQAKIASAATSDALQPLYGAWVRAKEDGAITASCKIQRAIKYSPVAKEAYTNILGKAGVKILELGADKTPSDYGIKLEVRPSYELRQAAIKAATEALKPGKNGENITLPDWFYFVNMIERGRAKPAMAILKYRLEKSKEDMLNVQRENMQLNGQNMVQQAQAKTQGELATIQAEGLVSMKEEAVKALLQMQVNNNDTLNALKQEIIQGILVPQNTAA